MADQNEDQVDNIPKTEDCNENIAYAHNVPTLSSALHGMSDLINTRLSPEALNLCLEMIESGVHPKAMADAVLHILEVKKNRGFAEGIAIGAFH